MTRLYPARTYTATDITSSPRNSTIRSSAPPRNIMPAVARRMQRVILRREQLLALQVAERQQDGRAGGEQRDPSGRVAERIERHHLRQAVRHDAVHPERGRARRRSTARRRSSASPASRLSSAVSCRQLTTSRTTSVQAVRMTSGRRARRNAPGRGKIEAVHRRISALPTIVPPCGAPPWPRGSAWSPAPCAGAPARDRGRARRCRPPAAAARRARAAVRSVSCSFSRVVEPVEDHPLQRPEQVRRGEDDAGRRDAGGPWEGREAAEQHQELADEAVEARAARSTRAPRPSG